MADYDFVPWSKFYPNLQWQQGDHGIVIARTGNGKTTLESFIAAKRSYVVVFVTKVYDETFRKQFPNYTVMREWRPRPDTPRILLWPVQSAKGIPVREIARIQREAFQEALNAIFDDRGWCMIVDEAHWMTDTLGLGPELAMMQHQGRSSRLSTITGVQRPAHIPVITYGSATHAFLGRQNERSDLARLSNLGGVSSKELGDALLRLPKFEWIYVDNISNSPPIRTRLFT